MPAIWVLWGRIDPAASQTYHLSSSLKGVNDPDTGHTLSQPEATMGASESKPLYSRLWGLNLPGCWKLA